MISSSISTDDAEENNKAILTLQYGVAAFMNKEGAEGFAEKLDSASEYTSVRMTVLEQPVGATPEPPTKEPTAKTFDIKMGGAAGQARAEGQAAEEKDEMNLVIIMMSAAGVVNAVVIILAVVVGVALILRVKKKKRRVLEQEELLAQGEFFYFNHVL